MIRMPRPSGFVGKLFVVMGGGFLLFGLGITAIVWATDGPLWVGATWTGMGVLLSLVFVWAYGRYKRALPGPELAWAPAPYGEWFELGFTAPSHDVRMWLNLDVDADVQRGGETFSVDVHVIRNQEVRPPALFAFHWRAFVQEVVTAPLPPGRQLIRVTVHEKQSVENHGGVRHVHLRCLARMARFDVEPGDAVQIRGCIHSSTAPLRALRAEAFVG